MVNTNKPLDFNHRTEVAKWERGEGRGGGPLIIS